ncbi:hypothetical protein [Chroococcidiopsis sp.]|uniref:hypothetical protein n=1 Tax=Chroococcidiopsis sp. TaxID=3088168 RepID=UPI003F36D0A8
MLKKPDCTGWRFGRLVVLGKGEPIYFPTYTRYVWRLRCDCGNIINLPRGSFDRKGNTQKSCGCLGKSNYAHRKPRDITGQRFGSLVAIALTGKKVHRKPTWLMQCDCGGTREMSLTNIRTYLREGSKLNCLSWQNHPDKYFRYPATPNPYPIEAGNLVTKYLHLTKSTNNFKIDARVEDMRVELLLRAAWILTYKRQQGEQISDYYESCCIRKYLSFASIKVFWQRYVEQYGDERYTRGGKLRRNIGNVMTHSTLLPYPVKEETQGNIHSSICGKFDRRKPPIKAFQESVKKLKFLRR